MIEIGGFPHFRYNPHIGNPRALFNLCTAILALISTGICLAQEVVTDPPHVPSSLERQAASIARMQKALNRPAPASLAAQRKSVLRQTGNPQVFIQPLPPSTMPPLTESLYDPPCDPLPESEVDPILRTEAASTGVAFELLKAIVGQESAFRPCAESSKGAIGLMQLMPETAAELGASDPWNPKENIRLGASYFKEMLARYDGDMARALAAYNAGPAAVDAAGGVPEIPETQDYVEKILAAFGKAKDANKPANTPAKENLQN